MLEKKNIIDKYMDVLTSIFKWIYLFFILLFDNSIVYDTLLTKSLSKIIIIVGCIILLWRILNINEYIKYPYIKFYAIFMLAFLLTIIVNFKYGYIGNVKLFIWMTFQFFLLYLFNNKGTANYEFEVALLIIIIYTTIVNIIGIKMLFTNFVQERLVENNKRLLLIGVAYWGRLFGVHTDPNYGAVLSIVSIMSAMYIFIKYKRIYMKIAMAVTIFIQIVHISFSASRTGLVCICIAFAVFFFFYSIDKRKKIVVSIISSVVAICMCLLIVKLIPMVYNAYVDKVSMVSNAENNEQQIMQSIVEDETTATNNIATDINSTVNDNVTTDVDRTEDNNITINNEKQNISSGYTDVQVENSSLNNQQSLVKIGRDEEIGGDISNRRFDLWKNGLQTFLKSPIIGIGFGNIIEFSKANMPDCYILNNSLGVFGSYHNFLIDLLVSQGLVGTIIFIFIIICSLKYIIMNYKYLNEDTKTKFAFLISTCICIVCSNMFTSGIVYCNNETTVIFWLLWGYLINMMYKSSNSREGIL